MSGLVLVRHPVNNDSADTTPPSIAIAREAHLFNRPCEGRPPHPKVNLKKQFCTVREWSQIVSRPSTTVWGLPLGVVCAPSARGA
jgi:hypothetical protein